MSERYQDLAARTEAPITSQVGFRLVHSARLLHGTIGLQTEVGELADQLKRHVYYGTELDMVNVEEEAGDVLWYLALIANAVGFDLEEAQRKNIEKLRRRFPEKFTERNAVVRDLETEREALER